MVCYNLMQLESINLLKSYYSKLYSTVKTESVFEGFSLPRVSSVDRDALDAPVTRAEIETAIMKMAS